jgi:hypothetical protein
VPTPPPGSGPGTVVGNVLSPNPAPPQEYAQFSSMSPSPDYSNDHTILASGAVLYGCSGSCFAIYRTTDSGHSWQHMSSQGFSGGRLLLSPHFPDDHIVFAVNASGVQESDNSGASFRPIVPTVTVAALAPDSPSGAPRLLLGNQPLAWYSGGTFQPGPVLPVALTDVSDVAFGAAGAILVSGIEQDPLASTGGDSVIVRCAPGCAVTAAYPGEAGMTFAEPPSPADHSVAAFNKQRVSASSDGGQTFTTQRLQLSGIPLSVAPFPGYAQNRSLLLGWSGANGAFGIGVSHDAGASVQQVSLSGLPTGFSLSALRVAPDGRWFATLTTPDAQGDFGIRCSTDQGATWAHAC